METPYEEVQTIVIDNGSSMCRVGFAGMSYPCLKFPSVVGEPKINNINNLNGIYIGDDAFKLDHVLAIRNAINNGNVTDWEKIEKIYSYTFDILKVNSHEHPVILTETVPNSQANCEKMEEILFETFEVPALHIDNQALFSCFSNGCDTGIVLESGDGVTQIVPVYEGSIIKGKEKHFDLAGIDVTKSLQEVLNYRLGNTYVSAPTKLTIFRTIKENIAYVVLDFKKESENAITSSNCASGACLPDGTVIGLNSERFECTEILFNPKNNETDGIDKVLFKAIMDCNEEVRNKMFNNIILSGGNVMLKGFHERLEKEIMELAPEAQINVVSLENPKYSAWLGGSNFLSLAVTRKISSFHTTLTKLAELTSQPLPPVALDKRKESFLRMEYGFTDFYQDQFSLTQPPSPRSVIPKIEDGLPNYQTQQKDQRYYQNFTSLKRKLDNVDKIRFNKTDIEAICKTEPYQKFWLTLDIVSSAIKEIVDLPYFDAADSKFFVSDFVEALSSYVRKMYHQSSSNQTKAQLNKEMKDFITTTRSLKQEIIQKAINLKSVDIKMMPKDKLKDYEIPAEAERTRSTTMPRKTQKKNFSTMNDLKIIAKIFKPNDTLPPYYQYDTSNPIPNANFSAIKNINPIHNSIPPLTQPKEEIDVPTNMSCRHPLIIQNNNKRLPNITKVQIPKTTRKTPSTRSSNPIETWRDTDPLPREGDESCNSIEQLHRIVDEFEFIPPEYDGVPEPPFKLTDPPETNEAPQHDDGSLDEEYSLDKNLNEETYDERQENAELPKKKAIDLDHRVLSLEDTESLDFLQSLSIKMALGKNEGEKSFQKIQKIWDSLGFSAKQKFSLVLKYTTSLDESQKLDEALTLWQAAADVSKEYDSSYYDLKIFLKHQNTVEKRKDLILEQMLSVMKAAVEKLKRIAEQLKIRFDDDLILHGNGVYEVISARNKKIELLVNSFNISD
ncbi:actin [Histomonas meleagridis]|uniref:actin n=1 Tax=Histomonas meleagridis TaxID=135588 RepID=UPI00355958DA|nr:actin [Histomonas meleagridis]KAH0806950.1 actin [Histomonas meleagridis]